MINNNHITLLFGLPGAGKTTTLSKIMPSFPKMLRLSGGSLIAGELSTADRDSLRKLAGNTILLNQERLVLNFQSTLEAMKGNHVIFDGHCIVKNGETVVEIPLSVIERLHPDRIIFFDVSPEEIVKRRITDISRPDREVETVEELEKSRLMQLELCRQYALRLGITFEIAVDQGQLESALHG